MNVINDSDDPRLKFLENFRIFANSKNDVGRIAIESHVIRVKEGTAPISLRPYRQSPAMESLINEQVNAMLIAGIIRPSISPWSAPITMAMKKDGSRRLCVDYRRLNAVTVDERTPIPYIEDLLQRVANSSVFSTLDLAWGFWQVPLEESSIEKSAFVTSAGQFEFVVVPFGIKNGPSTCQRILRRVLEPLRKRGIVENYLDDIVVHTSTDSEHEVAIRDVIKCLADANIRLRREKCHFFEREIELLGHVVSEGQIKPCPSKVRAIMEFPRPFNVKSFAIVRRSLELLPEFHPELQPDCSSACMISLERTLNSSGMTRVSPPSRN